MSVLASAPDTLRAPGLRKNGRSAPHFVPWRLVLRWAHAGKQWHEPKRAFRPTSGLSSYAKRQAQRQAQAATKAKEKEMKDEKEDERQVRGACSSASGFFFVFA